MIKKLSLFAVVFALVPLAIAIAEESKAKTCKCPVAGKTLTVGEEYEKAEYKKGEVLFCCAGCKGKFTADTKKYAAKANKQLVATGQYKQVKCPIAGRPVNASKTVKVAGVDVGLCCGGCQGKLAKAKGDAQIELAFNDKAFAKGFAPAKK